MKKPFLKLTYAVAILFSATTFAQTPGTLTVVFTPTVPSGSTFYSGTKNSLAAWIQNSTGNFVKTNLRYFGGGTSDHLPTWVSKSASSTTGAAATGATKSSFASVSYTWNGTNTSNVVVADGTYNIVIEDCWNHGTTGIHTSTVSFVKGTSASTVTPVATNWLKGVSVIWRPANTTNIENTVFVPMASIYPNPSEGVFTVNFKNTTSITVLNMLGAIVFEEKVEQLTEGSKNIDLSKFNSGIYFVNVSNGTASINHKIILTK